MSAFEKFCVTAPGKVILFGEHSVVYGKRAVACGIDIPTVACVFPASSDYVLINFEALNFEFRWPLAQIKELFEKLNRNGNKEPLPPTSKDGAVIREFISLSGYDDHKNQSCLIAFLYLYTSILNQPVPLIMKCKTKLPIGSGLGSSAALAVSLSGAFMKLAATSRSEYPLNSEIKPDILNSIKAWAFSSEHIFHGKPSGVDNTVCSFGGVVSFKMGNISNIDIPHLKLLLVNTKVPKNTKKLVEDVRLRYDSYTSILDPVLTSMDNIADSAVNLLQDMKNTTDENDRKAIMSKLSHHVLFNHGLLRTLGVSHPSLEKVINISEKFHLPAKLTGAGGGGFAIVIGYNEDEKLKCCKKELEDEEFEVLETILGCDGVRYSEKYLDWF